MTATYKSRAVTRRRMLRQDLPCLCLAICLLFSAIIPYGMMPDRESDGLISFVICSQFGFKTVYVDEDGIQWAEDERPLSEDHPEKPSLCVFASVIALAFVGAVLFACLLAVVRSQCLECCFEHLVHFIVTQQYEARAPPPPL